MPSKLAFKAANISDTLLSRVDAMGTTYPFVTLTVYDGGDMFRLTSFSGPPDIEYMLTRKYRKKRRCVKMGPVGYSYINSEEFDSFMTRQESDELRGSRLESIKVWTHKHVHGLQFRYRKPKLLMTIPHTEEELNQRKEDLLNLQEQREVEEEQIITQEDRIVTEEHDNRFWLTDVYGSDTEAHSTLNEFFLGDNEYLTNVEIDHSAVLMCIKFTTNTGRTATFGTRGGTTHQYSAFPSSAIVGFHGLFGPWGDLNAYHLHKIGVWTEEIYPEIEGDCEVLRLLGKYTYRLKEVIPMSENKRFYIFKFQDLDDRAIQRKECLV